MKAVYRVLGRLKYLEKTVHSGEFKNCQDVWRNRCEPHVAIALHGSLKAADQQADCSVFRLPHSGAVKHHAWTVNVYRTLKFAKEGTPLLRVQCLRQLFYQYGPQSKRHFSASNLSPRQRRFTPKDWLERPGSECEPQASATALPFSGVRKSRTSSVSGL